MERMKQSYVLENACLHTVLYQKLFAIENKEEH